MTLEYLEITELMTKKQTTTEVTEAPESKFEAVREPDMAANEQPSDKSGAEAVSVIILTADADGNHASLSRRSVEANLIGVDVEGGFVANCKPLAELLADILPQLTCERVVLMTDSMFIANPVTLGDVACTKKPYGHMPFMIHRSALLQLLEQLGSDAPTTLEDLHEAYVASVMPEDFSPITLGEWRTDPWLLPIVSVNPNPVALRSLLPQKKFVWVSDQSWTGDVESALRSRLKETV